MTRNVRLVIIIAVIVIAGGFAFYAGIKYQGETVNENTNTDLVESDAGVVYLNDDYNYQVTFPEGWAKQDDQGEYVSWLGPVAREQEEVTELLQGMKLEIWTTDMVGVTLQDAVDAELDVYSEDEILNRSNITVDDIDAIKVKTNLLGYTIATYILKDDILYKFIGYVGDETENAKYVAQYSSLLSEFKFSE
ncbi:MAG: hypothetical protein Q8P20_10915 [bacterium]|nr:hypothetical protein [bacterium]